VRIRTHGLVVRIDDALDELKDKSVVAGIHKGDPLVDRRLKGPVWHYCKRKCLQNQIK
jgi:hypothetical protein